jgi:hypothetical protein
MAKTSRNGRGKKSGMVQSAVIAAAKKALAYVCSFCQCFLAGGWSAFGLSLADDDNCVASATWI